VRRRFSGVSISGVPLQVGTYCLYHDESCDVTCLGKVFQMFNGEDDSGDPLVIFRLERKPITTSMGHYCFFLDTERNDTVFVSWTQIDWKCKILKMQGGQSMALPFASCTSCELMEFSP
jgi:hypothetical protein